MTKREILNLAYSIALNAHIGQLDKQGKPYINHVVKVSNRCKSMDAKIVAMLHDVIEDCDGYDVSKLIELGVPDYYANMVMLVTKVQGESYEDYKKKVKSHPTSIEVKINDLKHNMDWTRNKKGITPDEIERTIRYHRFYVELYNLITE